MKILEQPTGKLSRKNGCVGAELIEFLGKLNMLMIERDRVISDADLYKLVYLE